MYEHTDDTNPKRGLYNQIEVDCAVCVGARLRKTHGQYEE